MLVLTRKKDETVWLGRKLSMTVRDIQPDRVRVELCELPAALGDGPAPVRTHVLQVRRKLDAAAGEPKAMAEAIVYVPVQTLEPLRLEGGILVTVEGLTFAKGAPTRARLGIQAPREVQIVREEIRGRYFAEPPPAAQAGAAAPPPP